MPSEIKPCLATQVEQVPKGAQWLHEIKWDGYRLIVFLDKGKARVRTRNGLDWTKRFPTIAKAVAALPVSSAILDGEAVIEDENGTSSFAALQQALSNTTQGVASDAIFYAFDLLYLDGEDLRAQPLGRRKDRLAALLTADTDPALRLSAHLEGDGAAMAHHACRLGLVGVREDEAVEPVAVALDEAQVGQDDVDAGQPVVGEADPEVDHEPAVAEAVEVGVDADLAHAAQGDESEFLRPVHAPCLLPERIRSRCMA